MASGTQQEEGMPGVETEPCPGANPAAKPHKNLGFPREPVPFTKASSLRVSDNTSIH